MAASTTARLRLTPIWRDIFVVYGRHWRLLVPLAVLVLLPQATADALVGEVEIDHLRTVGDFARLALLPATIAINLGGEAVYAGIVAAVVVHWRRGEPLRGIRGTARELPLGRLVAGDLVLALGTAIGFALLIVPGLLFFAYFAITPALIELRRVTVREAFVTSARLVRGSFWRVLIVAVAILAFTDAAGTALSSPTGGAAGEFAFDLMIEAALQPFQGLMTVLLALALIELHPDRVP